MRQGHNTTVRVGGASMVACLLAVGFAALAALLAFAASADAAPGKPGEKQPKDAPVLNVGHRGASGYAPEHTIPSYDLALKMGADYIEQDLQLTRDGVLVVLHDETLDRTARPTAESQPGDCTGLVREKTLAQIKTCDVGSWFNEAYPQYAKPEYVGLKIPTLEEVFRKYRKSANYYIETKSPESAPGMEEELLRLMDEYGLTKPSEERWQVLIQSFSPTSLQKIHALNPSLPLIQLFFGSETSETIQARLDATRAYAVGIGPSKSDVDRALVEAAHARCLDVHPYTVNETPEMEQLVSLGVDGMFTNFPDRLDAVLGKDAANGKTAARLASEASESCRRAGSGEASAPEAILEGRATYPVETRGAGSIDAPAPFPDQPVGGYSALLDARGKDTYLAMPDNGYGSKANSQDFVLRVDRVRVDYETAKGGEVEVLDSVFLRDPDRRIPFPTVDENGSGRRLLTGSDFDPESMRVARDGTWWFGDEFGPFLLHTDSTGKVLEAPIPLPGVKAPEDPTRPEQPVNLRSSSGFEGMAISKDGRYLYPSLERSLNGDDIRRHYIYEFDTRAGEYTGKRWAYRADLPVPPEQEHVIGDMTALDGNRLLVIERDFLQGEQAQFSKIFVVDLRREDAEGFLEKREVVDLLNIRDPEGISLRGPVRPGDYGLGDPFEFPYVTTESVLPLGGQRLAIVNDNNFGPVRRAQPVPPRLHGLHRRPGRGPPRPRPGRERLDPCAAAVAWEARRPRRSGREPGRCGVAPPRAPLLRSLRRDEGRHPRSRAHHGVGGSAISMHV